MYMYTETRDIYRYFWYIIFVLIDHLACERSCITGCRLSPPRDKQQPEIHLHSQAIDYLE